MVLNINRSPEIYPHRAILKYKYTKETQEYKKDKSGNIVYDDNCDPVMETKTIIEEESTNFKFKYLSAVDVSKTAIFSNSDILNTQMVIQTLSSFGDEIMNNSQRIIIGGRSYTFSMARIPLETMNTKYSSVGPKYVTQFQLRGE